MADTIFRREWDYLMNVFGEPTLGFYFVDYKDAVRNQAGEITGGKVYLTKQCNMRGIILEDPLTLRNLDSASGATQFLALDQACVFKCSATDLIAGGVLKEDGTYALYDNEDTPYVNEGVLNHKYVMYRGQLYEVVNFDRGVIFTGDPSNAYITTTRDVDYTALHGKAELVIVDGETPTPPDPEGYTVTVDGVLLGTYLAGTVVHLTVPSKPGYQFNGWVSDNVSVSADNTFVMPNSNVVVNSVWTADTFKVVVTNPGTGGNQTYTVENGSGVELKAGTYTGYNFHAWVLESGTGRFVNATATTTVFTPTSDCSIRADWTEVADPRHTLTIIGVGDTITTKKYATGEKVALDAGTKEGYTFTRWTSDPAVTFSSPTGRYTNFTMPDSDVTVTAIWTEDVLPEYTVRFWLNGDTSDETHNLWETVTVLSGASIPAPDTPSGSAVPSGKTFNGWWTTADGGVEYDLSGGTTKDLDLFAHWKGVERTVTFDTDGGNEIPPRIVEDGMPIGELPVPVKPGFKFVKWTDELGRETIYPTTIVDYDMTIVAVWEESGISDNEVDNIDLDSDVAVDFITVRAAWNNETGTFERMLAITSGTYGGEFITEHFYAPKWGLTTPPEEFSSKWTDLSWPVVSPCTTPQTAENIGQQTALVLYRHDSPAAGDNSYKMGIPVGYPSGSETYITFGVTTPKNTDLPTWTAWPSRRLCCLVVRDIGDGWYRYEFGFLPGITNSPVNTRFPGFTNGTYDIYKEIPLD